MNGKLHPLVTGTWTLNVGEDESLEILCQKKLTDIRIRRKQDQKFFLNLVFAVDDKAILNAKDSDELKARLDAVRQPFDEEETCLTGTPTAQFFVYLSNHRKMMKR